MLFLYFFISQADISALAARIFAILVSLDRNLLQILVSIEISGRCAPYILHEVRNCANWNRFSRPQSRSIGYRIVTVQFLDNSKKTLLCAAVWAIFSTKLDTHVGPLNSENRWPEGVLKKIR